jgi:hypothetical protein
MSWSWIIAAYLLIGWVDASVMHWRHYRSACWKWIALAWPIRWLNVAIAALTTQYDS